MTLYHAVMIDETGCEFGAEIEAETKAEASDQLRENYPESRIDQLESPADSAAREKRIYDHISRGGDWDDEGRPFFHDGGDADYYNDYEEEE